MEKVERLVSTVKPAEAEALVTAWIGSVDSAGMEAATPFLQRAIGMFLPKRRARLQSLWLARIEKNGYPPPRPSQGAAPTKAAVPVVRESNVRDFAKELRLRLQKLSDQYIFQWATRYTTEVRECFWDAADLCVESSLAPAVLDHIYREFREHTREAFETHMVQCREAGEPRPTVVDKSRRGLLRFLQIPVATSRERSSLARDFVGISIWSRLCSAMLRGILIGYSRVRHEDFDASAYLLEIAPEWCDVLPYLYGDDLYSVANELPASALKDAAVRCIHPVATAIERVARDGERLILVLPGESRFSAAVGRLEYTIQMASGQKVPPIVVHYYLAPDFADVRRLEESAYRGAALVIGAFPNETQSAIQRLSSLRHITINTNSQGFRDSTGTAERATAVLQRAALGRGAVHQSVRLTYNWAKEFPLHTPVITEEYRVRRPTVRTLLGNVERRNGVHVWCSVRRSGKSTACFALESTTGASIVLAQTTAPTSPYPGATQFFRALDRILRNEEPLPDEFVNSTVRDCIPAGKARSKVVLILDEYESMFHRINAAALRDTELRYTIAQPLLSQLVAFSRDNLLIFVGQRPDAHQILLDQNQLSPFVQQNQFPLFEHHSPDASEFKDLLTKVLPEPFNLDTTFVQEVYGETGGHPYLTVGILVSFVEWLIEQQRSTANLTLHAEDFGTFVKQRLSADHIALVSELGWFYGVIGEALSDEGRSHDPWLHAVYWTMQQICTLNPGSFACSHSEYRELAHSAAGRLHVGYDPDYVLRSASEANFLTIRDEMVMPRIRLLGRLAAVASARTSL
ncbi:MAG TPA: hypothetical protein VFR37_02440 [Longimicrobium sp.]|nr:hypothetical protein [Longimicrobium sp.]